MVRSFLSLAALVVAVLGCGQAEPPSASSEYFPMRAGSRWSYSHSNGGWTEEITLERVDGESELLEQRSEGDPGGASSRSELRLIDGDVLRVAEDQLLNDQLVYSVVYDPGFLRFSSAWVSAEVGDTFTEEYERTETDVGQDASDPERRAHRYTIEALSEDVSVPAGTFRNCLRVHRERALDLVPDGGAVGAQGEQEKLFWFAAGVGKVREENVITGSTEVLTRYEVPEG